VHPTKHVRISFCQKPIGQMNAVDVREAGIFAM
jgi:hypothetical protein